MRALHPVSGLHSYQDQNRCPCSHSGTSSHPTVSSNRQAPNQSSRRKPKCPRKRRRSKFRCPPRRDQFIKPFPRLALPLAHLVLMHPCRVEICGIVRSSRSACGATCALNIDRNRRLFAISDPPVPRWRTAWRTVRITGATSQISLGRASIQTPERYVRLAQTLHDDHSSASGWSAGKGDKRPAGVDPLAARWNAARGRAKSRSGGLSMRFGPESATRQAGRFARRCKQLQPHTSLGTSLADGAAQ